MLERAVFVVLNSFLISRKGTRTSENVQSSTEGRQLRASPTQPEDMSESQTAPNLVNRASGARRRQAHARDVPGLPEGSRRLYDLAAPIRQDAALHLKWNDMFRFTEYKLMATH